MSRKILIEKIEETTKVSIWDTKTPDKKRYYYYNLGANVSLDNNNKTIIVDDLNVHPYPRLMFTFEDLDDNLGATDAVTYADAMASNLFFLVASSTSSSVTEPSGDELISVGAIEVDGNNVTIDGVVGVLNSVTYTVGNTVVSTDYATAGFQRIDLIVLNTLGELEIVLGTESNTVVVAPALPADTLLVTQLNVTDGSIDVSEPIVVVPGAYKTYFVNTSTGNNTTGVYQDPSKPFATIDYIFALPTWKDGDIIELQNKEGIFPINSVFPKGTSTIKSDFKVTLDFSANANSRCVTSDAEIASIIHLDLPHGIIRNERSGSSGVTFFEENQKLFMNVKASELYWNTSNPFASVSGYRFDVNKVSVKNKLFDITDSTLFNKDYSPINIAEFVCLGVGSRVVNNLPMGVPITIAKFSGTGSNSFYFSSAYYNIGDIATGGRSECSDNSNPIVLDFKNSTISTVLGLELCNYYGGSVVITGVVKSATKINFLVNEGAGNNLKVVNFSGDIGSGILRIAQGGSMVVENSFIKSATSPLAFYTGFGTAGITLRNSAFQMTNPGPLVVGGYGDTRTINIAGVSHNGTMYSDAEGVGVTVTSETIHGNIKLPKYTSSRNDGVNPNNKVLNVDASGNLKLYTMATMPPPYLEDLIPDSNLPSTSGVFVLKGSFFTPTMTVAIAGQTINSVNFISDNEVRVNITTGASEGTFDVTLNNGTTVVFPDVLLITLGTVYKPVLADYINIVTPLEILEGELNLEVTDSSSSTRLVLLFNKMQKWSIYYEHKISPVNPTPGEFTSDGLSIRDSITNNVFDFILHYVGTSNEFRIYKNGVAQLDPYGYSAFGWHVAPLRANMRLYWDLTQFLFYRDGNLIYTVDPAEFPNNILMDFLINKADIKNIKYVIHP